MNPQIRMSGNHFLLDTNIIIGLFANDHSVIENIKSHQGIMMIPSIVLGELFYGAELSGKKESNTKKIEDLARITPILSCDTNTARIYGNIKSVLKLKVLLSRKTTSGLLLYRRNTS